MPQASIAGVVVSIRSKSPESSSLFPYTTLFRSRTDVEELRRDEERARRLAANVASWRNDVKRLCAEIRSEWHTSERQSPDHIVCRVLVEKDNTNHSTVSETP